MPRFRPSTPKLNPGRYFEDRGRRGADIRLFLYGASRSGRSPDIADCIVDIHGGTGPGVGGRPGPAPSLEHQSWLSHTEAGVPNPGQRRRTPPKRHAMGSAPERCSMVALEARTKGLVKPSNVADGPYQQAGCWPCCPSKLKITDDLVRLAGRRLRPGRDGGGEATHPTPSNTLNPGAQGTPAAKRPSLELPLEPRYLALIEGIVTRVRRGRRPGHG